MQQSQGKLHAAMCVMLLPVPCMLTYFQREVRTYYYSQGTQIYCAPTVDARPEWQHTMNHIALEGRCFVLCACQYAEEKDYPPDHAVADPNNKAASNVVIAGGSVIVSPLGKVLAGPLRGKEGILTADLDLNDVVRGKFDLDATGHYARPDGAPACLCIVFKLQLTRSLCSVSVWTRPQTGLNTRHNVVTSRELCFVQTSGSLCSTT